MRTRCDPLRTTSEPPLPAAFGDGYDVQSPSFLTGCARTRSHRPTKTKTEHLNALMMHRRNGRSRRVSAPGPPRGAAGGCARTAPPRGRGCARTDPPPRDPLRRHRGAQRVLKFLSGARTAAFPPGWPPQDRLVYSVRLGHRNEARPGGSYQPCRGPVGGPSSSWHHSTPQRDHRALQTRHGHGDYTNTALPEQQLKASTWKPVVSGEPPPSRHHASLAEDGLDRSTAPIGRSQTRVADSLCLLRLGVDALAPSRTVQRTHRSVYQAACARLAHERSSVRALRGLGLRVGDGARTRRARWRRVDAADACYRCASSLREDRG